MTETGARVADAIVRLAGDMLMSAVKGSVAVVTRGRGVTGALAMLSLAVDFSGVVLLVARLVNPSRNALVKSRRNRQLHY